ncbi:MAG: type I 3-dehydroquinate dehydratase [Calditrichaeota bacterium]|nr:type I 3-dehydroquinate dehydratase [Calditrichota bacterium]
MHSRGNALCLSLLPEQLEDLKAWAPHSQEADLVELRLDRFQQVDFPALRQLFSRPLIYTCRLASEGGHWQDAPEKRIPLFQSAIEAGFDYIDVEFESAEKIVPHLQVQETQLILSHHTDCADPETLIARLRQMFTLPAAVYKLIYRAHHLNDNLLTRKLIEVAREQGVRYIIHAMGEEGQLSRILGGLWGNAWTYVAFSPAKETASGQFTLQSARYHYFLPEKSSDARIIGLVGDPIKQSKGYRLHNLLFHQKLSADQRKKFVYVNFPAADFPQFWQTWKDHLYGLSVTIPHKETVVAYLKEKSPCVRISGVCNTMIRTRNGWKGHNTDLFAIEHLLKPYKSVLREGAVIIGTGATARSAIAALKRLEVYPIVVTGRNHERGQWLARLFGINFLTFSEVQGTSASVIIQTTPVGMFPDVEQVPPGIELLKKDRIVLDVIYNPRKTRFLQIAEERGCHILSGVDMFLLQAARQFKLFTGMTVSVQEVREAWEKISFFN